MDQKPRIVAAVSAIAVSGALVFTAAGCSSDDSGDTGTEPAVQADVTTGGNGEAAPAGQENSSDKPAEKAGGGKASGGGNAAANAPGEYVDYSPDLVGSTPGRKLLYFHASWCPQCQALEDDIETNGLPDGVTVFKVDYDSNQDLRQEYGVTLQTTMVEVDSDGKKIDSYVAYEEPTFDAVERNLLK